MHWSLFIEGPAIGVSLLPSDTTLLLVLFQYWPSSVVKSVGYVLNLLLVWRRIMLIRWLQNLGRLLTIVLILCISQITLATILHWR